MKHIIYDNLIQGSNEWFEKRLGKATSSRFGDIMTLPRGKKDREDGVLSKTARTYMIELLTEKLTGETRQLESTAMEWGTENEPLARNAYELETITEVKEVGFIELDEGKLKGRVGASTDGLIGDSGILEIKCPWNSIKHTEYLLGGDIPKSYIAQMQGALWITGRKYCDFVSYNTRVKEQAKQIYIKRIERNEEYIKTLEERLLNFIKQLDNLI